MWDKNMRGRNKSRGKKVLALLAESTYFEIDLGGKEAMVEVSSPTQQGKKGTRLERRVDYKYHEAQEIPCEFI